MDHKSIGRNKRLLAYAALVGFFSSVRPLMSDEMRQLHEAFGALSAFVRPLTSVRPPMGGKISHMLEASLALNALVRSFTTVQPLVAS